MPIFEDASEEIQVQTMQNIIHLEDPRSQTKQWAKTRDLVPSITA